MLCQIYCIHQVAMDIGQGRTKTPLGFQVKVPSAHLLTTRSGHFTQMRIPIFIVWFDSNWNRTQVSRFSSRLFIHSTTHWLVISQSESLRFASLANSSCFISISFSLPDSLE